MKFTLAILTTLATVLAADYDLHLSSDNSDLNNQGLEGMHEGAGISYIAVRGSPLRVSWDRYNRTFTSHNQGDLTTTLSVNEGNFLQDSVTQPGQFELINYNVVYDGSDTFYACKNVNDPYNYSKDTYLILQSNSTGDCEPVKIVAEAVEDVSSSSAPSSSAPSSWSSSASGWSSLSSSAAPWSNTTTTDVTVTDYTTYCPNPTTITITTCTQDRCAPHPITVTGPTTVTVTGECVVPSTPAPAPQETTPATTVAGESTAPTPTVTSAENGVGKNLANYGAAAIAIAAALI